jgi:hypothetical protein
MPKLNDVTALIALFAAFLCGAAMGGIVRPGSGVASPHPAPVLAQK